MPDVDPLDPCPNCGSRPNEAPEGVFLSHHPQVKAGLEKIGAAIWRHPHCWKCGFRPASNEAAPDITAMRDQWNAFQKFQREQAANIADAPGMSPPDPATADAMKAVVLGTDTAPVIGADVAPEPAVS